MPQLSAAGNKAVAVAGLLSPSLSAISLFSVRLPLG
jgi:hypothetical protein